MMAEGGTKVPGVYSILPATPKASFLAVVIKSIKNKQILLIVFGLGQVTCLVWWYSIWTMWPNLKMELESALPLLQKNLPQNQKTSIDLLGGQGDSPRKMRVVSLEKEGCGC